MDKGAREREKKQKGARWARRGVGVFLPKGTLHARLGSGMTPCRNGPRTLPRRGRSRVGGANELSVPRESWDRSAWLRGGGKSTERRAVRGSGTGRG